MVFLPQPLPQTPLAPVVVSPFATCAGGVCIIYTHHSAAYTDNMIRDIIVAMYIHTGGGVWRNYREIQGKPLYLSAHTHTHTHTLCVLNCGSAHWWMYSGGYPRVCRAKHTSTSPQQRSAPPPTVHALKRAGTLMQCEKLHNTTREP